MNQLVAIKSMNEFVLLFYQNTNVTAFHKADRYFDTDLPPFFPERLIMLRSVSVARFCKKTLVALVVEGKWIYVMKCDIGDYLYSEWECIRTVSDPWTRVASFHVMKDVLSNSFVVFNEINYRALLIPIEKSTNDTCEEIPFNVCKVQ